ncbi:MAG: KH domain-containing protein [Firmicutes bacterium]|nr:KH domain-containing protein [Bacillota bacterium]
MLKNLVKVIAKNLVEFPDSVFVEEEERDDTHVIKLRVASSDMGKVIGKQGRIAKAIRTVVKAASISEEKKVIVEIVQ